LYRLFRVSIAELEMRVKPCGEIGSYLVQQLVELNHDPRWTLPYGESWALGDSPAVTLLLDDHEFHYEMKPAPRITQEMYYVHNQKNRAIRVYHYVDPRLTFEDMYAKLALNFPAAT
jgi:purine nucleosidase